MDTASSQDISAVAVDQLASRLGLSGAPVFVDVRKPASDVMATAAREGAIPFDVPDVRISHRGPQGERCSFDALIEECGLDDPVLLELAHIVRGADTGKPALTPQSTGLPAISLGLSVNFPDDHAMLEQGMVICDAPYAWLRAARSEVHNATLFAKQ